MKSPWGGRNPIARLTGEDLSSWARHPSELVGTITLTELVHFLWQGHLPKVRELSGFQVFCFSLLTKTWVYKMNTTVFVT